jgi:acetyltransferase-like isoleucine patch superfamily enzyme
MRRLKTPKMIWGYQDASGAWREGTRISDTVFFNRPERVFIGNNVFVWHHTILDGTGGLTIGEGSMISSWVGVFTHSVGMSVRVYGRHYHEVRDAEKKGLIRAPVSIGKYVVVGAGTIISPGVTIGDGAAVLPGSVVDRDVGTFEAVSGNPARVVREDVRKFDKRLLRESRDPRLTEWYNEWQET